MFRASYHAAGVLIAVLAMASCDGSTSTAPETPKPPSPQSIDIAVSESQVTLLSGTSGTATATLTRGGFTGPVTISVSGLPAGVTALLSPQVLNGNASTTTIQMTASDTALEGSYNLIVRAASSFTTATATYKLLVVDTPHFHMSLDPSTFAVAPGTSGSTMVNIVRRGEFAGEVTLSVADVASGLTVLLEPQATSGRSILTVRVAQGLPHGSYSFTIVANGPGVPTLTSRVVVHVKTSPADWYVVAEPSELTVTRGSSGTSEVRVVTDVEIPGWATYSLVNPPAGISATFEYWYDWGYPATMMIFVDPTVAAGRYTLTLAVSFPGTRTETVPIDLTVKDP
jgi:uncharacterized membrane protein